MKIIRAFIFILLVSAVSYSIYYVQNRYQTNFAYAGTVEATRVNLPARLPTVIDSILVQEGQVVKAGQKVASLSCDELEIAARLANDNFKRAERLIKTGSMPKEAFDLAESKKSDSNTKLSWCTIASPINGVVLTRYFEPKEWVSPGSKILTLADLENLWTYFYVPSEVMAKQKVGAEVVGIIPELDSRSIKGTITKINDEAEFTPKNVQTRSERTRLVFGVKVSFKNAEGFLKPGMTIEATL